MPLPPPAPPSTMAMTPSASSSAAASVPPVTRERSLEEDLSQLALHGTGAGRAYLAALEKHPSLGPVLQPDFQPSSFAAQVVSWDAAGSSGGGGMAKSRAEMVVAQLTEQLGRVEDTIEKHILQHQQQLMQSMGDLGELKENSNVLTIRSKELRRSVNKLNNELLEPYQTTELRTQQLRRIHAANDLLKKVSRFSVTLARLRKGPLQGLPASAGAAGAPDAAALRTLDPRELGKAADHVYELETLIEDPNLGGISLVAADRAYMAALGQGLRQAAKESVRVALRNMNQADLGPALQVFYNLRGLAPVVLDSVAALVAEAAEATRRAFDAQGLERVATAAADGAQAEAAAASSRGGGASSPPASSSAAAAGSGKAQAAGGMLSEMEAIAIRQRRARYRHHCDRWATVLYDCAVKAWHLQRVLYKQVDPSTDERFLDVVLQSGEFRQALARATAAAPSTGSATAAMASLSLSRSASQGQHQHQQAPPPVDPLYWLFWLDFTAAVRKVADAAAKRAAPNAAAAQVVKCYPYFSLALVGVLHRLVDSTSKHTAGLGHLTAGRAVGQGNLAVMRALVEALGGAVGSEGLDASMGDGSGLDSEAGAARQPASSLLVEVGATVEERDALVEALAGLRTLYLGASLQRLCKPVEQMFPRVEGYQAAIPSKHDLQAFFRAMQAELLGGLAEGGPLLLPHLVRGLGKAVGLFCAKVEAMAKGGDGARNLNPLRGWVLSPEKEHNLQLLQLVAFLHQALRRLPRDLAAAAPSFVGGAVGAGALGCEREIEEACAALEALAVGGFIQPYLADMANELGGILAEMHLENYAPKQSTQPQQRQQDVDGSSGGAGGGADSRFIASFQAAVAALRKHHLSRFPTQAEFAVRGLQWLAGRLLRIYVSHAALIRPLNEAGKVKLNNDMAMVETSLQSIYPKVSELGPPYQELRALRELCFYGDDHNPVTVAGVLKERFVAHLRPSTLLDFLFSRAPLELSSPHVLQRCSERTLVAELLSLYYGDRRGGEEEQAAADGGGGGGGGGEERGHRQDPRLAAEAAHWQVVQVCLDAYAQRMSAVAAEPAYLYDVMLNLGPALLKTFEERLLLQRDKTAAAASGSAVAALLPLGW